MTTDITELAQREKFEAWWEREYKHLESSKYTDAVPHIKYGFWMAYQAGGAELVEALEKSRTQSSKWLEAYHKAVSIGARYEERIAELESRTVKLPDDEDGQAYGFGKWANGKLPATAGTMTIAYCEDAWRAAFEVFSSAAGIKVNFEGEQNTQLLSEAERAGPQERRKAERDTEPYGFTDGDRRGMIYKPEHADRLSEPVPVYRHAQPAPVVPEIDRKAIADKVYGKCCRIPGATFYNAAEFAIDEVEACLAAMLQELKKSAGTEAICRSDENVQVLHTKSPAQSDCCPAQNDVAPAQSPIDHGYLPECECSGCKATARICAELAGNSQVIPDGYVMVPDDLKEAAADLLATLDDYPEQLVPINRDSSVVRALRAAMLAAAPQEE